MTCWHGEYFDAVVEGKSGQTVLVEMDKDGVKLSISVEREDTETGIRKKSSIIMDVADMTGFLESDTPTA